MTKIVIDNLLRDANQHLEMLLASASTSTVRTKLRNLHDVCQKIVCDAKMRLSVPLVWGRYGVLYKDPAQAIAQQSIRNKRASGNPYQSLYRKWEEVAEAIAAAAAPKNAVVDAGIIGGNDIRLIDNPTLRHQVTMLVAQNRSLYNQLNILKQNQTDIPIRIEGAGLVPGSAELVLSDAEVEAVRDFVDPRKLRAKHLKRTTDDGVKTNDGRPVGDPGLVTALEKIARSCERQ
jgi:hypothetical protein